MPRRTLTRLSQRRTRNSTNKRNRNVAPDSTNNGTEQITAFDFTIETYKIAFTCELTAFQTIHLGTMDCVCSFCGAIHFQSEKTAANNNSFSLCCHKGKVKLDNFPQNDFFENLFNGLTSNNAAIKKRSKNYFQNIRSYNAAFAMISSEAEIDQSVANGVYFFKNISTTLKQLYNIDFVDHLMCLVTMC